jgi:unspecific monooxygenase
MLHEITLRSLLSIVFGDRREAREQVLDWFRTAVWRDLRSWKPWTNLSRLHGQMRELLCAELDARRRSNAFDDRSPDLLDMLLAGRDENGTPLNDQEIQDQILMLTITAGDAVAVATTWALYCVGTNPKVQERVRAEHHALGVDADAKLVAAQPYLTATVQEVLRLHTVLPTVSGRKLTAPRDIAGYHFDAGVMLAPCEYLIHRRADIFEEPLEFRPERFVGRSYAPHQYFPFGGSQRACLGSHLAPLTIKLVLATILSQFRLTPTAPEVPQIVRYGTLLAPEETLALQFTPV